MGATAGEFVVFQGNRTFSSSDNGFHYYYREGDGIPSAWPSDWTAPVDYWHGVWHVRVAVLSTPESRDVSYQTCIWMHDESGNSSIADELESCSREKVQMNTAQVYSIVTDPLYSWWHKNDGDNAIDISRPHHYKRMGLVFRTGDDCYVSPYDVSPNCWDQRTHYIPMGFHLTIVAVSSGAAFSGWEHYAPTSPAQRPAQFTRHPQNITVAEGSPASFTVETDGAGTLTYQWQVIQPSGHTTNASNSNSPTFQIASANQSTSGFRFRCIATNSLGTATSDVATLTVTPAATVTDAARGRTAQRSVSGAAPRYAIDGRVLAATSTVSAGVFIQPGVDRKMVRVHVSTNR